jgi:hypothetical protein
MSLRLRLAEGARRRDENFSQARRSAELVDLLQARLEALNAPV